MGSFYIDNIAVAGTGNAVGHESFLAAFQRGLISCLGRTAFGKKSDEAS